MEFREWLMKEKNYSDRASRDVQSRLKRALGYAGDSSVCPDTMTKLEANSEFKGLSMSVKSQMRRAIRLHNEFTTK